MKAYEITEETTFLDVKDSFEKILRKKNISRKNLPDLKEHLNNILEYDEDRLVTSSRNGPSNGSFWNPCRFTEFFFKIKCKKDGNKFIFNEIQWINDDEYGTYDLRDKVLDHVKYIEYFHIDRVFQMISDGIKVKEEEIRKSLEILCIEYTLYGVSINLDNQFEKVNAFIKKHYQYSTEMENREKFSSFKDIESFIEEYGIKEI